MTQKLTQVFDTITNKSTQYPISIQINLLNKCYQKCIGCRKYEWPDIKLRTELVKQVVGFMPEDTTIVYSGGEPLLHKDINEILKYTVGTGKHYGVLTAAVWPTTVDVEFLVKTANYIAISIDGATEETYTLTRGVNTLKKAIENVKQLVELKQKLNSNVRLRCNSTISNLNVHEMHLIYKLCADLDIECRFFPIHTWNDLKIKEEFIEHVNKAVLMSIDDKRIMTNVSEFINLMNRKPPTKCIVNYIHMFVDADGNIFPCCRTANDNGDYVRDETLILGNINYDYIGSIWFSERAEKIRERLLNPKENVCMECDRYNKLNSNYAEFVSDRKIFI